MSEGTTAPVAPKNNTGTIALVVAGILLFVVCGMAYKDYVDSAADKERANWGNNPQAGYRNPAQGAGFNQQNQGNIPPQPVYNNQPGGYVQPQPGTYPANNNLAAGQPNANTGTYPGNQGNTGFQAPVVVNQPGAQGNPPQIQGNPPQNQGNPNPANNQGQGNIFSTAPAVNEPATAVAVTPPASAQTNEAMERRRRELEQLRKERMIAEGEMRNLANGGTGAGIVSGPVPGIPGIPTGAVPTTTGEPAIPSVTRTGVAGEKPAFGADLIPELGVDPVTAQKMGPDYLAKLKQEAAKQQAILKRIQNSPAIAKVKLYDSQWNFVEIDGGKDRNLSMAQRLTVRRGSKILGVIEITELGDNYAVGELRSANAKRDDSLKPQAGDDLIPEELF